MNLHKYYPEVACSIVCLALGMLSGYIAHAGDSLWYASLNKPFFTPPSWIFSPVWTLLYIMMGIVAGIMLKEKNHYKWPLIIFALQLIFNLAWSPLFFYFHRIDLALADICLLLMSLCTLLVLTRKQSRLFLLLLPYTLWVSFALLLNLSIYINNG